MRLPLVTMLTDQARQMQVPGLQLDREFFMRFTAGAGKGRFPGLLFKLPTRRTPQTQVRFLRAFQQEDVIALIETIEQRGDLVGQRHPGSEPAGPVIDKSGRNRGTPYPARSDIPVALAIALTGYCVCVVSKVATSETAGAPRGWPRTRGGAQSVWATAAGRHPVGAGFALR